MKMHFILAVCIMAFLLNSCLSSPTIESSKEDRLATSIQAKMAKKLMNEYQLRVVGDSARMPEGVIEALGLEFHVYRILTREDIRELLVNCVHEFVAEINSNEEVRVYLKNYPVTSKNISIGLTIRGSKGEDLYDPDIRAAFADDGILWYGTKDKNKEFGYKSEYEETFEEAEKLVGQAHSQN